ncbi:TIGR02234 family membrane protein [Streptomyces sp. KR80]|uniref:TIGR02234 family membrane protein n=1 Tax=Streptomyces sp. KR80 TaxID=3457426 RepID=UPI003FD23D63
MSAAPQTPDASATAQPARSAQRSLAVALLLGAVGAALALVAGGQTWSHGTSTAAQGAVPLTADGRDVTGLPAALAVVGLAALVAVFAVRRVGRVVVAALLALSGAAAVLTSFLAASDTGALEAEAAKATGLAAAGVEQITHTVWPWISAAGGALLLIAGLLALRFGPHWPAMSGRYERDGRAKPVRNRATQAQASAAPDLDRPEEIWKALDRGEDPTREA